VDNERLGNSLFVKAVEIGQRSRGVILGRLDFNGNNLAPCGIRVTQQEIYFQIVPMQSLVIVRVKIQLMTARH
jgi:hypothetical protein